MIEIDNIIGNKIIDKYDNFFKRVNPNQITTLSFIFNLYFYKYRKPIMKNFIILYIRLILDILDGCVARKYDKCSKTGALLDSLSDIQLTYYLSRNYIKYNLIFYFYILNIFYYNTLIDHKKIEESNIFNNFFKNNTLIFFIPTLFIILKHKYNIKKKLNLIQYFF